MSLLPTELSRTFQATWYSVSVVSQEISSPKCKTRWSITYREKIIDIDHDFCLLQR